MSENRSTIDESLTGNDTVTEAHTVDTDVGPGDESANVSQKSTGSTTTLPASERNDETETFSPSRYNALDTERATSETVYERRPGSMISPRSSMSFAERGTSPRHWASRPNSLVDPGQEPLLYRRAGNDLLQTGHAGAHLTTDDETDSRPRKAAPTRNQQAMTVETETVPSVPTLAVLGNTNSNGQTGSLRIKKSADNVTRPSRQRKRGTRLAAASKADIFAAKVASAVDEADSSNSDETFVYDTNPSVEQLRRPYLRTASTLSLPTNGGPNNRNSMANMKTGNPNYQSQAGPSANQSQSQSHNSSAAGTSHNSPTTSGPQPLTSPPIGRDFLVAKGVRDRDGKATAHKPRSALNMESSAKQDYLQRWRTPGTMEEDDDDEEEMVGTLLRPVDEYTPLRAPLGSGPHNMRRYTSNPHDYGNTGKPPAYLRAALGTVLVLTIILAISLVTGLLFASSRPLQTVHIARINDVVPSDRELVFSLIVRAKNPGYMTVRITEVDLDVFATSNYVKGVFPGLSEDTTASASKQRTVLLGNIRELESELEFSGGFINPKNEWSMAEARIVSPGGNGTDVWQNISAHAFDLTVRGVLKYDLLFSSNKAAVSSTTLVAPPLAPHDDDTYKT